MRFDPDVFDEAPIKKDNEWGCSFDNPFSLAVEDLARFYFFNYWCKTGQFPPSNGVHDRIHDTEWFPDEHCKGPRSIAVMCTRFKREVC